MLIRLYFTEKTFATNNHWKSLTYSHTPTQSSAKIMIWSHATHQARKCVNRMANQKTALPGAGWLGHLDPIFRELLGGFNLLQSPTNLNQVIGMIMPQKRGNHRCSTTRQLLDVGMTNLCIALQHIELCPRVGRLIRMNMGNSTHQLMVSQFFTN